MGFNEVNLWVLLIAYQREKYSYALDLSCPDRKRLEVSKNVKYIAVTSRASKLQVFKVQPGWDLNPGHPHESLNIEKLTHQRGPGHALKTCNFEALEGTAMYFTFSETSSFYLFEQERSRAYLFIQSMICYLE